MASTLDIGACIKQGVAGLKANPVFAIVGLLLAGIVSGIPLVGLVLGVAVHTGYMNGLMKGKDAQPADVFANLGPKIVPGLILGIVSGILIFVSCLLLILPVLVVAPMVALAVVHMAKNPGAQPIDCLKKGKEIVMGNLVTCVIAGIVFGIVGGIGGIVFGIGALLTMPIAVGAWICLYDQATSAAPAAAPAATPA